MTRTAECGPCSRTSTTDHSPRNEAAPEIGTARVTTDGSMQAELLGGGVVAVVDLQEVAGGVGVARVVEAAARARVVERAVVAAGPDLRGGAVAVEELYGGVVGGRGVGDVEALAERPDAAVARGRPSLGIGTVARVELDRGHRRRIGAGHVGAEAARSGDRSGWQPPDLPVGVQAVVELQLSRSGSGVGVGHVEAAAGRRVAQRAVGAEAPLLAGRRGAGRRGDRGAVGGAGRREAAA